MLRGATCAYITHVRTGHVRVAPRPRPLTRGNCNCVNWTAAPWRPMNDPLGSPHRHHKVDHTHHDRAWFIAPLTGARSSAIRQAAVVCRLDIVKSPSTHRLARDRRSANVCAANHFVVSVESHNVTRFFRAAPTSKMKNTRVSDGARSAVLHQASS